MASTTASIWCAVALLFITINISLGSLSYLNGDIGLRSIEVASVQPKMEQPGRLREALPREQAVGRGASLNSGGASNGPYHRTEAGRPSSSWKFGASN